MREMLRERKEGEIEREKSGRRERYTRAPIIRRALFKKPSRVRVYAHYNTYYTWEHKRFVRTSIRLQTRKIEKRMKRQISPPTPSSVLSQGPPGCCWRGSQAQGHASQVAWTLLHLVGPLSSEPWSTAAKSESSGAIDTTGSRLGVCAERER